MIGWAFSRAFAFAAVTWALGFALFVVAMPLPAEDNLVTDAVVVPTGGGGRIARGAALLANQRARRMLITGVGPGVDGGDIAASNKLPPALFACCVDLGRDASDTRTNAEETVAWLRAHHLRSMRLVTTDWHMRRARFELDRAGGGNLTIVEDAVESRASFMELMREYNKYLLRRVSAAAGL